MSVILTITDTQSELAADSEPAVNGFHHQDEEEENAREAELVVFNDTTQGLGLKICGGCSVDGKQDNGIFIKRVLPGGLAEMQGGFEEGDLILDVNGQSMEGISYDRALSVLRQASASNHVEVVVTRDEEARAAFTELMLSYAVMTENGPGKSRSPPVKQQVIGEPILREDNHHNFQPQTLHLDQSFDGKEHGDNHYQDDMSEDRYPDSNNTFYSPASSCNSELGRHMPPMHLGDLQSTSPPLHAGGLQSANQQPPNLQSLHSVLSDCFPQDPGPCRFPVAKLEMTLQRLGFFLSAEKHTELLKHIPIDAQGLTSFDDFVRAVKQVFHSELQTRRNSQPSTSTPPLPSLSPSIASPSLVNGLSEEDSGLRQENEDLRRQLEILKEDFGQQQHLCEKAEEQVLSLRKESQIAMEESRSLRTKLRLVEQSQEAARTTERDYEQVVAMLENEISHLRLQMAKSDGINEHRRLAVAACQLKKSEQGKKTYEVATNKLMAHLQHVQDVLAAEAHLRAGESEKGEKKKKKQRAVQSLLSEGQDVIRTVQTLVEQVPLPFGWEENYTADGVRYYINHMNQTTSWTHPSSNVEHQSITMTMGAGASRPPPAVAIGKRSDNAATAGV